MLDPKRLRNDLDAVIAGVARRGFAFDRDRFESLEAQRKELQVTTQNLQNERNSKSKGIGKAKAAGEDIQPLLDAVASLGDELRDAQEKLAEVQQELLTQLERYARQFASMPAMIVISAKLAPPPPGQFWEANTPPSLPARPRAALSR